MQLAIAASSFAQSFQHLLHVDLFPVVIAIILVMNLVGVFIDVYYKRARFWFDAVA